MEQRGKFILMGVDEFRNWLDNTSVSRTIRLIQNHHTYIPGYAHFRGNNHFSMLQGMENAHLLRGFNEIAQNITVFPDGKVAICRSLNKIPAGIKGANAYGICLEHIGNFDQGGDTMNQTHAEAIVRVNAILCNKFSLPVNVDTVVYHHWWDLNSGLRTNGTGATKSCPGSAFFGGNKVSHAEQHFYPLVRAAMSGNRPSPAHMYEGTVNASTLNVRNAPDSAGTVIRSLSRATPVIVYAENNGWLQIHPSRQEWVSARYISRNNDPVKMYDAEVTASTLNVRIQANAAGAIIRTCRNGELVAVYEESSDWCRVHPYQSEWVAARYLRKK
jgi:SH3-like domain-containing protein